MNNTVPSGYKQTEIGVIPEDWGVQKLGVCATFRTGPFGSALHKSDYTVDGVPVINPMHIIDSRLVPTRAMSVSHAAAKLLSEYRLKTNDIIMGRRGDMGRCAVVQDAQAGWLCGTGSIIIQATEAVDPPFLQRILSSPRAVAAITDTSVGTTMINLNQSILAGVRIQLPPLAEQTAIAEALSDADAFIESLEQLVDKKRQIKQGAMQELLTGKRRLPDFHGEWKITTLGQIISRFSTGLNPRQNFRLNAGGDFFYVTIKNFSEGKLYLDERCDLIDEVAFRRINERSDLRKDDILFSSIGRVGDTFLIPETPRNWNINESVFSLRPNKTEVVPVMLFYLLTNRVVKDALDQGATGSTFKSIKQAELKAIPCRIPVSHIEQTAIATILSDMDTEIAALETKLSKARQIKHGMMQELLTGRIRLI